MHVPMNPVLAEMLATRRVRNAAGETARLHSNIDEATGRFLQEHVLALRPAVTVEVGLAYGTSAMFVCDALASLGGGRHVAFDPMQDQWGDEGLDNLHRAGHAERFELVRKPAHLGLATFEESGQRTAFVFVDGWHTFDHTLVDLFHADRVLEVRGILALDDLNLKGVRKACAYFLTNRAYELAGTSPPDPPQRRFGRAGVIPDGVRTVAMRKLADDDREWNAHTDF